MIGKSVSAEELQEMLDRETNRDKLFAELEDELKAIKPGECLVYETKEGASKLAHISMSLLAGRVKGLKTVTEDRKTYVYRPK